MEDFEQFRFHSVYQFLEGDSKQVDTNANVSRVLSIHSRI